MSMLPFDLSNVVAYVASSAIAVGRLLVEFRNGSRYASERDVRSALVSVLRDETRVNGRDDSFETSLTSLGT